ncbi:RNA polymerase sigma factor [Jejudonia soesokkakensis]|uniref:RNA polymerase sigma factor n=1 Tax=Jejudonia soesokkakensis TaxID=1323432 RepID=A0ABW2MSV1_9FLAO
MSLKQLDITKLLSLCGKGNQLAQLEVYNRYEKAMYNVAFRIVKDTAEAEDVMQESFIAAFSKLKSFKGDATFGAWLKRIVVNNSISQYKKSSRFVCYNDELQKEEAVEMEGVSEENYSYIKHTQLIEGMETLKASYRQALSLHYIEGYDYEEICEILNISYGNCRTLISRAKDSLRKKLAVAS